MNADLNLLEQQIDEAILNYEQRRKENRRKYSIVGVISATMAAVTTVLIGLSNVWDATARTLSALAIVTSALVTIVSSWESIYNHKKLWMLYTDKWVLMKELKTDLAHLKKVEDNQEAVNNLYIRYKGIVREFNDQWMAMKVMDKD